MQDPLDNLKYPIGRYAKPESVRAEERNHLIDELETFPKRFIEIALKLSSTQLQTPYRPGGWTGRQVIHHVPDSHMQAYTRIKLALTEDHPTIKPYKEALWSELPEVNITDINVSLDLLSAIHIRMVNTLSNVRDHEWSRTFMHPESGRDYRIDEVLALYVWHGNHHLAHLKLILG